MPQTIARKITLASLSLAVAIAVILGTASYLFTGHVLKVQIEEALSSDASVFKSRLEARLGNMAGDLHDMAANLVVVNALVDSAGREMYVAPFLASYTLPAKAPFLLTLCDFEGKGLLSGQGRDRLRSYTDAALLEQLFTRERPLARLEKRGKDLYLLIAYPVIYAATGRAEGMLVMDVAVAPLITSCLTGFDTDRHKFFDLADGAGEVWSTGREKEAAMLRATLPLTVQDPLRQLGLKVTAGEMAREAYAPLATLAMIYLLIGGGVLVLSLAVSWRVGRRLAAPLVALTATARQVAQTGNPDGHIGVSSRDEASQLAASFNIMLARLREARDLLEQRVADRTRELLALNEQLRTEVAERISAEETTKEYAKTQAVLLREVNHRVKNNLVAIISMLHREEDRARHAGNEEWVACLRDLVGRVSALLTVHRLLSGSHWQPLPLGRLCESLVREALKGFSSSCAIDVHLSPSDVRVDSDQAHHLAIVLIELVTNTLKYGVRGRDRGVIAITAAQRDETIEFTYQDDGPGYPAPILQGTFSDTGLGLPLVFGVVTRSLQGSIALRNSGGAVARISFPAAAAPSVSA